MSSNISQLKDRYVRQEETDYGRDWMLQIASLLESDFRSTNHSITDGNSSNNRKTQLRERGGCLLHAVMREAVLAFARSKKKQKTDMHHSDRPVCLTSRRAQLPCYSIVAAGQTTMISGSVSINTSARPTSFSS